MKKYRYARVVFAEDADQPAFRAFVLQDLLAECKRYGYPPPPADMEPYVSPYAYDLHSDEEMVALRWDWDDPAA